MRNPVKAPAIVYNLVSKRLKNAFGIAKTDISGVDEALKVCVVSPTAIFLLYFLTFSSFEG